MTDAAKPSGPTCEHCKKRSGVMLEMDHDWWLCVRCWLYDMEGSGNRRPMRTRGGDE